MNDNDYTCKHCNGTGMEDPECEMCEGKGWIEDEENGGTMTCPECDGEECSECDGTGEIE